MRYVLIDPDQVVSWRLVVYNKYVKENKRYRMMPDRRNRWMESIAVNGKVSQLKRYESISTLVTFNNIIFQSLFVIASCMHSSFVSTNVQSKNIKQFSNFLPKNYLSQIILLNVVPLSCCRLRT